MNTLIVAGSIALVAVVGFIYFTYKDWKEAKHNSQRQSRGLFYQMLKEFYFAINGY